MPDLAYGFEEGSGTTVIDSSGNGYDSTIIGTVPRVPGQYGEGLEFNGNDANYVSITPSYMYGGHDDVTLMAWIRRTAAGSDPRVISWANGSATDSHDLSFNVMTSSNAGTLRLRIKVVTGGDTRQYFSNGSANNLNQWYHIAVVWEGDIGNQTSRATFYIDGIDAGAEGDSREGPSAFRDYPGAIGKNGSQSNAFTGQIDEVRLFSRALTQGEIITYRDTPIVLPGPSGPPRGSQLLLGAGG